MDRNLALEIVRVTEASALAASRWVGKGDAVAADSAAVQAMHTAFNSIAFSGRVALGEGERGMVPQLFVGQTLGHGGDSNLDLAIDALECTRSVAFGRSNAMTVVAMAPEACFFLPPSQYLYKIAVGPEGAEAVDLNLSVEDNLYRVAEAKSYSIADLTVVILDRERHQELIATVRKVGARIHLIPDGDVAAAIATAMPGSGVDLLLGVGSSTAAVLSAAALQCLGGEIQARLAPTDAAEKTRLKEAGFNDPDTILRKNDMVRGDNVMFAATGITDGDVLNGVSFRSDGATTHSLVMRSKSRTRRFIVCEHYFEDNPVTDKRSRKGTPNMQKTITARHFDLTPDIKARAEEEMDGLTRFFDRIISAEFVLGAEKHRRLAELHVKVHAQTLTGSAETDDIITAIASAADKVTVQLKKYKGKMKDKDPSEVTDLMNATTRPDTDVEGVDM